MSVWHFDFDEVLRTEAGTRQVAGCFSSSPDFWFRMASHIRSYHRSPKTGHLLKIRANLKDRSFRFAGPKRWPAKLESQFAIHTTQIFTGLFVQKAESKMLARPSGREKTATGCCWRPFASCKRVSEKIIHFFRFWNYSKIRRLNDSS